MVSVFLILRSPPSPPPEVYHFCFTVSETFGKPWVIDDVFFTLKSESLLRTFTADSECPRLLLPAQPHGHGLVRLPRSRRPILCHCQHGGQATELRMQLLQPTALQWQQSWQVGWWQQVGRQEVEQEINNCRSAAHGNLLGSSAKRLLLDLWMKERAVVAFARGRGVGTWIVGLWLSLAFQGWFLGTASTHFFSSPSSSGT